MTDPDRPEWWDKNSQLKQDLGIPSYEPPRFADGTYTHSVVEDLQSELGCTIRFVGYDTEYPDNWSVEADGQHVMEIDRYRDENGNTVYELSASEFERRLKRAVTEE